GIFDALFFRLRDALLEVPEDLEREAFHEHLSQTFYRPWLDYLQCHEDDHLKMLAHSNPVSTTDITPIPVFSTWTILHYDSYSLSSAFYLSHVSFSPENLYSILLSMSPVKQNSEIRHRQHFRFYIM